MDCDDNVEGTTVNCPKCGEEIVPVHVAQEERPRNIPGPGETEETNSEPTNVGKDDTPGIDKSTAKGGRNANAGGASGSSIFSIDSIIRYSHSDGSFKTPLLAGVHYIIGIFWLSVFLFFLVAIVLMTAFAGVTANMEIFSIVIALAAPLLLAIISFGIAQVIYCIGKTAYNSDKIVELLTRQKDK